MLKKSIKYVDYNGEKRDEDFYFNLTKTELATFVNSKDGDMVEILQKITKEKRRPVLNDLFKRIILESYGEKSDDGRSFVKVRNGHKLAEDFEQTAAFDELYMELGSDALAAMKFLQGVLPTELKGDLDSVIKDLEAKGTDATMKELQDTVVNK